MFKFRVSVPNKTGIAKQTIVNNAVIFQFPLGSEMTIVDKL